MRFVRQLDRVIDFANTVLVHLDLVVWNADICILQVDLGQARKGVTVRET